MVRLYDFIPYRGICQVVLTDSIFNQIIVDIPQKVMLYYECILNESH